MTLGLRGRLLAGLAVLVFVAIASTGWVTLMVARGRLEATEVERVRALAVAVAAPVAASLERRSATTEGEAPGVVERPAEQAVEQPAARVAAVVADLTGVGGIREVAVIDAMQQPLAGTPSGDARLVAALRGDTLTEREAGEVVVWAPLRRAAGRGAGQSAGDITGALRLRVALPLSSESAAGSGSLLLALTLVDGGLILLFGALFLRQLIRPLEALGRAAAQVAEGDFEVAPLPPAPGELGDLTAAFNRMTGALRDQRRHLEATRAQVLAQEKLATVGRLAAGVAHEIGNPLTAVLGYVDLLLLDEKSPGAIDLLGRVKNETGRIHRIVHDLLDYARPAHEALEPVAWSEVLTTAESLLRPQPRFRDVALHNELPADLPPVSGSSRRLLQVALNLLLNAADAMGGAGTISVRARVTTITNATPSTGAPDRRVTLTVADSGPGIAPADRDRLFDPFFTTKPPGAGTGLGLAVCRSIVESLGGTVTLVSPTAASQHDPAASQQEASSPRAGAIFEVTLPVWRGAE